MFSLAVTDPIDTAIQNGDTEAKCDTVFVNGNDEFDDPQVRFNKQCLGFRQNI